MSSIEKMAVCANPDCGKSYPFKSNKKYCSLLCRKSADQKEYVEQRASQGLKSRQDMPTGSTGAAHELVVCADLLKRGFSVFRAQSPTCPCDLILLLNSKIFRVEVRTGQLSSIGKLFFPYKASDKGRFDILAVVRHNWEIVYHDSELKPFCIESLYES